MTTTNNESRILFDSVQPFFPANAEPRENCLLVPIDMGDGSVEVNVILFNGDVMEFSRAATVEEAIALTKTEIQSRIDEAEAEYVAFMKDDAA